MAAVDVLLPVKNCADYLAESIQSIIDQTYEDWRLLVLDHGSTDGSLEIATEFAQIDPRVEVHQFVDAVGLSGLLNKGLEICNCTFVMRHDADDVALPDRIVKSLQGFSDNPEAVVVAGHATRIDAAGNVTGTILVPTDKDRLQVSFFFKNPIIHPTVMMRFSEIQSFGIRYGVDFTNLLPKQQQLSIEGLVEDYYLFGQLGVMGKCVNLDAVLIKYRWHGNNVGAQKFHDQVRLSMTVSRYLAALFCIKHNIPAFDPTLFSTYGGTVIDFKSGQFTNRQLRKMFEDMSQKISLVKGMSGGIKRELAFRRLLVNRSIPVMLAKFLIFKLQYHPEIDEWYAIKSWVTRVISKRKLVSV